MEIKKASNSQNLLNRWNCRWKLFSLFILMMSISSLQNIITLLPTACISLIIILLAGFSFKQFVNVLKGPLIFICFMIPLILLTPGENLLWQWKFIAVYNESAELATLITVKTLVLILIFSAMIKSSSETELIRSLQFFKVPGKMISILLSTYRFIFLYREKLKKLSQAAKLRGASSKNYFRHISTSINLILSLLMTSYDQSVRIQSSMILRGFNGTYPVMETARPDWKDRILALTLLTSSGALIGLEILC